MGYVRRYKVAPTRVMPTLTWENLRRRYPFQRPISLDKEEVCPICGRREILFPVSGPIPVCSRCLSKFALVDWLKATGRVYKYPTPHRSVKCSVCGKSDVVMFDVFPGKICLKCMWYLLGQQHRRLSVDGTRIV